MNKVNPKYLKWESCQYNVFDIMRFPLAILVIYIHCTIGLPEKPITTNCLSFLTSWDILFRIYISKIISSACVPTFFMISGYLFYHKQENFSPFVFFNKLKRRLRTIVIPYFIWIMLYAIITILLIIRQSSYTDFIDWYKLATNYFIENGSLRIFWDCNIIENHQNNIPIGCIQDNSAPLLFTLWYIRDLIIVILISPILYEVLKYFKIHFIFLLGIAYIFNLWPYIHGVSIVSIFFFTLGIYLSSNNNLMDCIINRYAKRCLFVGLILSLLSQYLHITNSRYFIYCIHIFTIFGVIIALYIGWLLIKIGIKPISYLKRSVFFIYAAHMVYLNRYCTLLVIKLFPYCNNSICGIIHYITIPFVIALSCLIIIYILQKLCPWLLSLLNGGR